MTDGPRGSRRPNLAVRIARFYIDGFRGMTVGRQLWAIIIIKVIILFGIFRLFFFPDELGTRYDNGTDRAQAVRSTLIDRTAD